MNPKGIRDAMCMREQLQKLIERWNKSFVVSSDQGRHAEALAFRYRAAEVQNIIKSNPDTEFRINPGWLCKDSLGIHWCNSKPRLDENNYWDSSDGPIWVTPAVPDPWADKPEGGPECLIEIT